MAEQVIPIRSTTQKFIELEDIQNDIALFADGSCALLLNVSAVNFGLLSQKEQDAIIYSYAGLLNSLSFPIQLIVRSQHKDISAYLKLLEEQELKQKNPKLSKSIHSYRRFVESTVKEKEVLDKKFYIIIPFSNLELGISTKLLTGNKKTGLPYPKQFIFERATTVLIPKRDQILRLLARAGLHARQLTGEQIGQLYFSYYNPDIPAPHIPVKNENQTKKEPAIQVAPLSNVIAGNGEQTKTPSQP